MTAPDDNDRQVVKRKDESEVSSWTAAAVVDDVGAWQTYPKKRARAVLSVSGPMLLAYILWAFDVSESLNSVS